MMKRIFLLMALAVALPVFAAAETWSNVSIVDTQCSKKAKADPDAHTRDCALTCAKSGFGILDKDGNYLKFDAKGNADAMKLLQSTTKERPSSRECHGRKAGRHHPGAVAKDVVVTVSVRSGGVSLRRIGTTGGKSTRSES